MKKVGNWVNSFIEKFSFFNKDKKAFVIDFTTWVLISVALLALASAFLYFEKDFLIGFISDLQNKMRFRG